MPAANADEPEDGKRGAYSSPTPLATYRHRESFRGYLYPTGSVLLTGNIMNEQFRIKPTKEDAHEFVRKIFGSSQDVMRDCFLTGSVAFDEATEESDIDLAFCISLRGTVVSLLAKTGIICDPSDYNSGLRATVVINGKMVVVNFLFLHPRDYVVWSRSGEIYKMLPHQAGKVNRHAIFETVRALVKTSLSMNETFITRNNYQAYLAESSGIRICPAERATTANPEAETCPF